MRESARKSGKFTPPPKFFSLDTKDIKRDLNDLVCNSNSDISSKKWEQGKGKSGNVETYAMLKTCQIAFKH